MKLVLKSGKSFEITEYNENWVNSQNQSSINRYINFVSENIEEISHFLTPDELSQAYIQRDNKENIKLPPLSLSVMSLSAFDSKSNVVGHFVSYADNNN